MERCGGGQDHTSEARATPAVPLLLMSRVRSITACWVTVKMDRRSLRDEQQRERLVEARAVEIEAVSRWAAQRPPFAGTPRASIFPWRAGERLRNLRWQTQW